ncbi:hypothetical protein L1887_18828 [Cichorium endivia]|nr:hypothetical protein L1887_18828 [Cichorium endivia]
MTIDSSSSLEKKETLGTLEGERVESERSNDQIKGFVKASSFFRFCSLGGSMDLVWTFEAKHDGLQMSIAQKESRIANGDSILVLNLSSSDRHEAAYGKKFTYGSSREVLEEIKGLCSNFCGIPVASVSIADVQFKLSPFSPVGRGSLFRKKAKNKICQ